MNHEHFMHRCLELAQKGRGLVGGNPLVGSVLVRDEKIIAEGYYRGVGTDHAEQDMITLRQAQGKKIRPTDGLYVNLEPCCHHGKTPPCTDAIIKSGIKNVCIGMRDPDERVAGKGIQQLIDNGITVIGPVLRAQCERLNRGYISLRTQGRPYITIKRAQTREGLVSNTDGTKLCITSQEQNTWAHTHLRSTHDAILVGVQTVIVDDPQLTIRFPQPPTPNYQPFRIILDPDLRIPRESQLLDQRTIIITQKDPEPIGDAQVIQISIVNNHFDWEELWKALSTIHYLPAIALASAGPLSTILVEGGPKTWESFKKAGIVDEEVILIG
ncbi:MAG: bifunctional diaminohydroxyphosphoribosylaminopyrimidine deaminase/5-amino-6-(5-phosphoribosylamino)uracil reductase RibD [bacterium]|nr:bifunctional diaminohydroxyphosphoribosylaminopyrimidine deaminase/5-amino-6-(5-phosphoribosylamino)uracil reductase RibD [bacterium]MDA1293037.1 bifunctional diaminohydroxyphosphoribosylaminopyrimidine deaminase/5-amino-6-(5-phosphoribosylamino)uracil reductase RibD [bacterium]